MQRLQIRAFAGIGFHAIDHFATPKFTIGPQQDMLDATWQLVTDNDDKIIGLFTVHRCTLARLAAGQFIDKLAVF